MAEQQINLEGGAERPAGYSEETLDKARDLVASQKNWELSESGTAGVFISLRDGARHTAAASRDEQGTILGITCTCLNGQRGGVRARCYHAAALELLMNERREK